MSTPTYLMSPSQKLFNTGEILRIKEPSLEITSAENAFLPEEIEIFTTAEIRYGLYVKENVPSLLLDFSVARYEYFLNVYELFAGQPIDLLPAFRGVCSFTVVNSHTLQQTFRREFFFCEDFLGDLIQELTTQRQVFRNAKQVNDRIEELELLMDVDKMYAITTMYTIPAEMQSSSAAASQDAGEGGVAGIP